MSEKEPLRALRPIDFLIPYDDFSVTLPYKITDKNDEDYEPKNSDLKRKMNWVQIRLDKLWRIWQSHYLLALRERTQKPLAKENYIPKEGDIVLLSEEETPRSHWKLARIVLLIRGRDGIIRTVKILINGKIFKRSINVLFPLEIQGNNHKMDNTNVNFVGVATIESSRPPNKPM
uniref:DUF5641 domain-containing protein n=1 Tax=Meloidogyne enterolobii TaxID=390850 RepID=A0A6V7XRJ5_MELEN|nr:unnamed protein product [Meloidogyne enterolobii]